MPRMLAGDTAPKPPKPKAKPPKPTYGSEASFTGSSQQQSAGNNKTAKQISQSGQSAVEAKVESATDNALKVARADQKSGGRNRATIREKDVQRFLQGGEKGDTVYKASQKVSQAADTRREQRARTSHPTPPRGTWGHPLPGE